MLKSRAGQSRLPAVATTRAWWYGACVLTVALAAAPVTTQAAESVLPVTPPGSTDVDQAFLPPPGFYGGFVAIPFSKNQNTYDSHGHTLPPQVSLHINTQIYVPLALYVYPFTLFGGNLASSFVQPIQNQSYSFGSSATTTQFGLSDAYSDILYWTKNVGLLGATPGHIPLSYGLSVGAGFALIIPDGGYDSSKLLKLGGHSWVLDPNFALTYNTGSHLSFGDNTQLSTRVFYAFPQRNFTSHYQSGQILDVDWAATEQFGIWRAGVAGYFQTQTTNDDPGNGYKPPNGGKFTEAGAGPIVEYFIPKWNAFLKAKYGYTFYHKSYVDQQLLVLSAGIKF